jgi:hypothetical protein
MDDDVGLKPAALFSRSLSPLFPSFSSLFYAVSLMHMSSTTNNSTTSQTKITENLKEKKLF